MTLVEQLMRDEGIKRFPYTDTVGKLTIGVGRNLTDVGITDEEIGMLLKNDIQKAYNSLHAGFPWFEHLDPVRQGALINMCFNLGFSRLAPFHRFIDALQEEDWESASVEMLDSQWARQVGDRALRLAEQVRTGRWV